MLKMNDTETMIDIWYEIVINQIVLLRNKPIIKAWSILTNSNNA